MSASEAIKRVQTSEEKTDEKSEQTTATNAVPKETYTASCHCNANAYTISMPKVSEIAECNCSPCMKEGALWAKGTPSTKQMSWIRGGEDNLTGYECFKKEDGCTRFMFCPRCGTLMFAKIESKSEPEALAWLNARAFREVDVYALEVKKNDDINTPPAYIPKKAEGVKFDNVEEGMRVYDGSCHCGAVTWKLKSKPLEDLGLTECNCSFCKRNGDLYVYPSAGFVLVSPESAQYVTSYQFGEKRLWHDFCKLCGVSIIERLTKEPKEALGVNVRCLDRVDIWQLERRRSDGWSKYEPQYVVE